MTIQEMDLDIRHTSWKTKSSADALSRNPIPDVTITAVQTESSDFAAEQRSDRELKVFIDYLRDGTLRGDDETEARKIVKFWMICAS